MGGSNGAGCAGVVPVCGAAADGAALFPPGVGALPGRGDDCGVAPALRFGPLPPCCVFAVCGCGVAPALRFGPLPPCCVFAVCGVAGGRDAEPLV